MRNGYVKVTAFNTKNYSDGVFNTLTKEGQFNINENVSVIENVNRIKEIVKKEFKKSSRIDFTVTIYDCETYTDITNTYFWVFKDHDDKTVWRLKTADASSNDAEEFDWYLNFALEVKKVIEAKKEYMDYLESDKNR